MQLSHEWHIPPWVQANLPDTAAHPAWRVWQQTYLWAVAARRRHAHVG
jgi:hypothetical protein